MNRPPALDYQTSRDTTIPRFPYSSARQHNTPPSLLLYPSHCHHKRRSLRSPSALDGPASLSFVTIEHRSNSAQILSDSDSAMLSRHFACSPAVSPRHTIPSSFYTPTHDPETKQQDSPVRLEISLVKLSRTQHGCRKWSIRRYKVPDKRCSGRVVR